MKKLIACALLMILMLGAAQAKEVTVIFNFQEGEGTDIAETVSLAEDANAFSAVVMAATNTDITLDMAHYEGMGFFINSIDGVLPGQSEYWAFFINYLYSTEHGMSSYVPVDNDIVEFAVVGYEFTQLELTVEVRDSKEMPAEGAEIFVNDSAFPLGQTDASGVFSGNLGLKKDTYAIKAVNDTQETTQELLVADYDPKNISITFNDAVSEAIQWLVENQQADGEIGSHKVWGNAFALMALNLRPGNESAKQDAMDYLLANQSQNAGFSYPGFDSDALHTAVSTMGLIANDLRLTEFGKDDVTTTDFLSGKQEEDGGFSGWGQSDTDTTAWAMLAFAAAGQQMSAKNGNTPTEFIISQQNSDGGFPYSAGQDSSLDYTAEALMALASAQYARDQRVNDAIAYIENGKSIEGCVGNAYTTALGAMALESYGKNTNGILDCLETLQLEDKGFGRDGENSNAVDTALAAMALDGETLPIKVIEGQQSEGVIQVESIVEFTVRITNSGRVSATNVEISINGIPASWVKEETSTMSLTEIKPGETEEASIFVEMKETGEYMIKAVVSGTGIVTEAESSQLELDIAAAELSVELERQ